MILFGLSMDYHVFVLSRIREAVDRGMTTEDAVGHGIKSTADIITSAAAVMVITFAMFATGGDQSMKQLGVGLAAAIFIDASLVRAVLLPATMKLLGNSNWYLPRRLSWLPKFENEPQGVTPAAVWPPGAFNEDPPHAAWEGVAVLRVRSTGALPMTKGLIGATLTAC